MYPFSFRIVEHSIRPGVELVEILQDGKVVGSIYPTEKGIKILSSYLYEDPEGALDIEKDKLPRIPAILINLLK
jgi:hypothetical protein